MKRAQSREGHETVNVPCTVPEAAESETFQEVTEFSCTISVCGHLDSFIKLIFQYNISCLG